MNHRTPIRVARPVTGPPCHRPCGLPYHQPGRRVQWQVWNSAHGRFTWKRGTVLAHMDRTLVVEVDGEETVTSCGPVVAEVAK